MITYVIPHVGQEDYLAHLAPRHILAQIEDPGIYAAAAVSDEEEERMCAGLIVFSGRKKESMELLWLYVDEDFRGEGIGGELFGLYDTAAQLHGAKEAVARLYEETEQGADPEAVADYLLSKGFASAGEDGLLIYDRASFLAEDIVQMAIQMKKRPDSFRLLSELSGMEKRQMAAALFPDETGLLGLADEETSVVAGTNPAWNGCALTRRLEPYYQPLLCRSASGGMGMELSCFALGRIGEQMRDTDRVWLERSAGAGTERIEKLLTGGTRRKGTILKKEM